MGDSVAGDGAQQGVVKRAPAGCVEAGRGHNRGPGTDGGAGAFERIFLIAFRGKWWWCKELRFVLSAKW
jgi:hypothetical protein